MVLRGFKHNPFSRTIGKIPGEGKQYKHNLRREIHRYTDATGRKSSGKVEISAFNSLSCSKGTVCFHLLIHISNHFTRGGKQIPTKGLRWQSTSTSVCKNNVKKKKKENPRYTCSHAGDGATTWRCGYFNQCRTFDVRKRGGASRERERKWKRLECPSHARSRGHNPGEGPAADILQNTYCGYHHSESNFNHVRYWMKPQEQHRGMQCFSSFSFSFFSLSLMEFCDFYTTWWYPDLLGTLQIRRCQQ